MGLTTKDERVCADPEHAEFGELAERLAEFEAKPHADLLFPAVRAYLHAAIAEWRCPTCGAQR